MSREIKFRVYSNSYKKYLNTSGEGILCEVHHLALKPDGKLYYADIGIDYPGTLSECPTLEWEEDYDDCVVEQYTGLKDKNGKEIYEGDIVKVGNLRPRFEVTYSVPCTKFWMQNNDLVEEFENWNEETGIEVIGNIHENPELLGGEE